MRCPNPKCGANIANNDKFCYECGQKLGRRNLEFITCTGEDEEGEPCGAKLKPDKKFCTNCGRKVKAEEFLLGNCQTCGEYCQASNKMCTQCLQTNTSENSRELPNAFVTEPIKMLTGSIPSCEKCGKMQSAHWSYCLHCGTKHPVKLSDQGATGGADNLPPALRPKDDFMEFRYPHHVWTEEDLGEIQSQIQSTHVDEDTKQDMDYDEGSDEIDGQILITMEEASVIRKVFDNEMSRTAKPHEIHNTRDLRQLKNKNVAAIIKKFLGLQRSKKTEATSPQKISYLEDMGGIQKPHYLTKADEILKLPDQANAASTQEMYDPEEAVEFQKVLDQCGYSELMTILEESKNTWRNTEIKVALTGESGSGKSSLINALRGLKDDDPGAAEADCIEATTKPTPYPHPSNQNLVIWDLPGVGTPNFPKEKYLEKARFEDYDFIILVSSNRYTENDTWLARQIKTYCRDANLFFVRTKIDVDLQNKQDGRRTLMSDEDKKALIKRIKDYCLNNLTDAKIKSPYVFMVNSHDPSQFEFGQLANMLVAKVSVMKKDSLILTIQSFTEEIVAAKYELCIERMRTITREAAIAAVRSNRNEQERLEMNILKTEVEFYKKQLGIDTDSLTIVARRFGLDIEEVYVKLNSETHVAFRNFDQYYLKHDKVVTSSWYSLPLIGQWKKLQHYQKQCFSALKPLLDKCVDENKALQKNIAVWSLVPN